MTDRPIIFSSPMVRAILREIERPGTGKTMTRRVIRPQPLERQPQVIDVSKPFRNDAGEWGQVETVWSEPLQPGLSVPERHEWHPLRGVLYHVGDRLWAREAWHAARSHNSTPPRDIPRDADIEHAATARNYAEIGLKGKLRPAMFLPRWASRITLIVTAVRVERLQDITEADALAEGVECDSDGWSDYLMSGTQCCTNARDSYLTLWDSLNAKRVGGKYSWASNPWIAAYTFHPILGNIDMIMEAA